MHHDKNTSINQASSSALNSLGKRERQPLQPRLCVPQNLELLESQCCGPESMRPQQTRARLRAVRLALHQYSHHHRLLLWMRLLRQ